MLYTSPIFGPVHSRRLGLSLGINLMPSDGKMCSFDCIYCECGFNGDARPKQHRPSAQQVSQALEHKLQSMVQEGRLPDVLTFAGNGEPTLHPDFKHIIAETRRLRDIYCPQARISVLTNATTCVRPDVHEALMLVDNNIQKLDTVNLDFIHAVDRPTGKYDLNAILQALCDFKGHVIIQTMFLTSSTGLDNTTDEYVEPWLQALDRIQPQSVMVYTIDRTTPNDTLRKALPACLDSIAQRVRQRGIECTVAY